MPGVFSLTNTVAQDDAVAVAIAGPIRLTLEKLTRNQVVEVFYWVGFCQHCGSNLKVLEGPRAGEIVSCYVCEHDS